MDYSGCVLRWLLAGFLFIFSSECISRRPHAFAKTLSVFGPEMGPEMLVSVLKGRGDVSAETNAHRIILSVHTASDFIGDVLESAVGKTLHSAISSRENLFFSLQRIGNDSRRIFELVDRATNSVCETARKAKQEINDAIRTSLDHLKESMKIIIRHLPDSKLNEGNLGSVIGNGQYRMEVVVENSGQRIIDAIQSYRSHFIKIDKDSGQIMVDPESSQEATDAVKNIIHAAKSQIQEAIAGSTSFILARIRDLLSSVADVSVAKTTPSSTTGVTLSHNGSDTFQAEVISVSHIEDPSADDKVVVMGDIPTSVKTTLAPLSASLSPTAEPPMIINTPPDFRNSTSTTTLFSTPKTPAFQDELLKDTIQETTSTPATTTAVALTSTFPTVNATETSTFLLSVAPVNRRRVPQIKPISSSSHL